MDRQESGSSPLASKPDKHDWLDSFWIPLLPIAGGLAVVVIAGAIWLSAGGTFPALAGDLFTPTASGVDRLRIVAAATTTRFLWAAAELLLAGFLIGALAFGIFLVAFQLRGKVRRPWMILAFGLPLLISGAVWRYRAGTRYGISRLFLANVLDRVDDLEKHAFPNVAKVHEWTRFTKVTDGLAAGVILLTAFAFASLLYGLSTVSLHDLGERRRSAAQLLYLSAGLLVAAVIQLLVLLSWPVAYLADQQDAARYFQALAGSMTLMVGVFFTVLLFAMAAPVFAVVDRYARKIASRAHREMEESAITELLGKHGFGVPAWSRAANIVAILGPAIAGLVGSPAVGLFTRLLGAAP